MALHRRGRSAADAAGSPLARSALYSCMDDPGHAPGRWLDLVFAGCCVTGVRRAAAIRRGWFGDGCGRRRNYAVFGDQEGQPAPEALRDRTPLLVPYPATGSIFLSLRPLHRRLCGSRFGRSLLSLLGRTIAVHGCQCRRFPGHTRNALPQRRSRRIHDWCGLGVHFLLRVSVDPLSSWKRNSCVARHLEALSVGCRASAVSESARSVP